MWVWWVAAAIVLGILEVLTVDLVFLMLALAALAAGVAVACGAGLAAGVGVFAVTAVLLLALVRPWAKRHLVRSVPDVATNAHALVGERAVVTERVDARDGRVQLGGETWSARTADDAVLETGAAVVVLAIDGATAVVGASEEQPE